MSAADKVEDIESWILQVHDNFSFESLISSSSADSEVSEDLSDSDVESWASIGEADFADSECHRRPRSRLGYSGLMSWQGRCI